MRILILGNNYSATQFFNLFSDNKENIVFTNNKKIDNSIIFNNFDDIVEFSLANLVDLVVIIDNDYIDSGLCELLISKNISVLSPDSEAGFITTSKLEAKKFAYKNKIKTPKFLSALSPKQALDYIKASKTPLAIKPDNKTELECTKFIETYSYGEKIVNELFESGNEKVLLEEYIEGKSFAVWTLTDGYSSKIIGIGAQYQNSISFFEPDFINDKTKDRILREIVDKTTKALLDKGSEYIGILGFNCIIDKQGEIYLLNYKNFFDDLSVDYFINAYDFNWAGVFNSIITGDVFLKYDFSKKNYFALALKDDDSIDYISANTKSSLREKIVELGYNSKDLKEAKKTWDN